MSLYRPMNPSYYFDPDHLTRLPRADLHVHTNLSLCADQRLATPRNMCRAAKKNGFDTVCFSNHLWDSDVPGASPWYETQDFAHVMQIKEQIPHENDMHLLVGGECEFFTYRGNIFALTEPHASELDLVLVPHSHSHMTGYVAGEEDCASIEKQASFLLRSFLAVITHPLAPYIDVVAHPFAALCNPEWLDCAVDFIDDSSLYDAFALAAQKRIAIEVNAGILKNKTEEQMKTSGFIRMFRLALKAGCHLTFGSDAHTPGAYEKTLPIVKALLSQI